MRTTDRWSGIGSAVRIGNGQRIVAVKRRRRDTVTRQSRVTLRPLRHGNVLRGVVTECNRIDNTHICLPGHVERNNRNTSLAGVSLVSLVTLQCLCGIRSAVGHRDGQRAVRIVCDVSDARSRVALRIEEQIGIY